VDYLDQFVSKYIGQRIDDDGGYPSNNPAQCWDLAHRYAREVFSCPSFPTKGNQPGTVSDTFWNFLQPLPVYFDKIVNKPGDPNQIPQRGDIIFWNFPHVAIVLKADLGLNVVRVFQQNAPIGAPCNVSELHYDGCLGWFRPKRLPQSMLPPAADTKRFPMILSFERTQGRKFIFNKDTHVWDLSFRKWADAVPVADVKAGQIMTAVGFARHELGAVYYMTPEDFGNADETGIPGQLHGVNVVDIEDYHEPASNIVQQQSQVSKLVAAAQDEPSVSLAQQDDNVVPQNASPVLTPDPALQPQAKKPFFTKEKIALDLAAIGTFCSALFAWFSNNHDLLVPLLSTLAGIIFGTNRLGKK
jgi:hypothetical protein